MVELAQEKYRQLEEFMAGVKQGPRPESNLIAILHKAQELFGYLDREMMDKISVEMKIPSAHIWGVATFYHYFRLTPPGRHTVSVCMGTACYVKGAQQVLDAIRNELKVELGETTEDRVFSLQEARCLGACGLAPVVMIDEKIYGGLDSRKVIELLRGYRKKAGQALVQG